MYWQDSVVRFGGFVLGWQNEDSVITFWSKFAVVDRPLVSAGWHRWSQRLWRHSLWRNHRWLSTCNMIQVRMLIQKALWSDNEQSRRCGILRPTFTFRLALRPCASACREQPINLCNYWDYALLCHIVALLSSAQFFCCLSSSMCLPLVLKHTALHRVHLTLPKLTWIQESFYVCCLEFFLVITSFLQSLKVANM